ncbi:DUF3284 domain-containing protein [Vagococcus elongatus]|uniref:DUF3284 domain-containing protein n=1 Tax=Vagococcus elongatus TaxID=180344 RepID=A0A430B412_9ENTE|nr:DUF3284 domain-containing protein [Vagococcus elongatus]RSU15096.1 hypothetical protein CBF29_01825 [Vagococcus elongatus]
MEIVKRLKVPASYFFTKVVESIVMDIKQSTGDSLALEELAGCEYEKKYPNGQRVKIRIIELVKDKTYTFETSNARNVFVSSYEIKTLDEGSCEIHYSETVESHGTLNKVNDALVGFMFGFFKKKQFKKMLEQVEASY